MKTKTLKKDGKILIESVEMMPGFFERMKGLLGRQSLGAKKAVYLLPCGSIHTFFMKFNLDLVFLDENMEVCRIVADTPPNRMVFGGSKAVSVLELETGWLPADAISVGDNVELV